MKHPVGTHRDQGAPMTNVLEAVAVAIAQGDSSPRRLTRRFGYSLSLVRRALQHPELPWLVEQVAPTPLLATSLERRLERLAGEALEGGAGNHAGQRL